MIWWVDSILDRKMFNQWNSRNAFQERKIILENTSEKTPALTETKSKLFMVLTSYLSHWETKTKIFD